MKKTPLAILLALILMYPTQILASTMSSITISGENSSLISQGIAAENSPAHFILADNDDDDDDGYKKKHKKNKKYRQGDDDDDGYRGKGKGKHKKHKWKKGKGKHVHYDYHDKEWRPYHNHRLPKWAQDCGLPPGLAKQNKIPPGWEKKCRRGKKYYEYEDEFRRDAEQEYSKHGRRGDRNAPDYQTIYKMDDAACKVQALKEAGSIAEGVAKGAVYGGVLGAATGILIEAVQEDGNQEHGAIYGATGGAAGGAVLGGVLASEEFKNQYRSCMRKHGHKVN